MKNLKNKKGITLVALVVTIIVLLILAGVSLSLVAGGNGIITRASDSSTQSLNSSAREQAELKISETVTAYYTEKYVNGTANSAGKLPKYLANNITNYALSDGTLNVTESGDVANVQLTVTKTGTTFNGTVNADGKLTWTN